MCVGSCMATVSTLVRRAGPKLRLGQAGTTQEGQIHEMIRTLLSKDLRQTSCTTVGRSQRMHTGKQQGTAGCKCNTPKFDNLSRQTWSLGPSLSGVLANFGAFPSKSRTSPSGTSVAFRLHRGHPGFAPVGSPLRLPSNAQPLEAHSNTRE